LSRWLEYCAFVPSLPVRPELVEPKASAANDL
jgi:hypothetical protein